VVIINPHWLPGKDEFLALKARYMVFAHEIGEQGTHHAQGYLEMKRKVRSSRIKDILGRAHCEVAHGNSSRCRAYVTKDNTEWEEWGSPLTLTLRGKHRKHIKRNTKETTVMHANANNMPAACPNHTLFTHQ